MWRWACAGRVVASAARTWPGRGQAAFTGGRGRADAGVWAPRSRSATSAGVVAELGRRGVDHEDARGGQAGGPAESGGVVGRAQVERVRVDLPRQAHLVPPRVRRWPRAHPSATGDRDSPARAWAGRPAGPGAWPSPGPATGRRRPVSASILRGRAVPRDVDLVQLLAQGGRAQARLADHRRQQGADVVGRRGTAAGVDRGPGQRGHREAGERSWASGSWLRAFEEDAVHQARLSARRHQQVDRSVEPCAAQAVQGQRVHARQHRLGTGDGERRLDALGPARRRVAQQHDAGLQPPPRPAVTTSFVDRAAGEAQRDEVGRRGDVVGEHAGMASRSRSARLSVMGQESGNEATRGAADASSVDKWRSCGQLGRRRGVGAGGDASGSGRIDGVTPVEPRPHPVRRFLRRLLVGVLLVGALVVGGTGFRVWQVARDDDRTPGRRRASCSAPPSTAAPRPRSSRPGSSTPRTLYDEGVAKHIVTTGGSQPGDDVHRGRGRRQLAERSTASPTDAVIAVPARAATPSAASARPPRPRHDRGWHTAVIVSDPWHSLRARTMADDAGARRVDLADAQRPDRADARRRRSATSSTRPRRCCTTAPPSRPPTGSGSPRMSPRTSNLRT